MVEFYQLISPRQVASWQVAFQLPDRPESMIKRGSEEAVWDQFFSPSISTESPRSDFFNSFDLFLLNKLIPMLRRKDSTSQNRDYPLEPYRPEDLDVVLPQFGQSEPNGLDAVDPKEEIEEEVLDWLGIFDSFGVPSQDSVVKD